MRTICLLSLLMITLLAEAQQLDIVPQPVKTELTKGNFVLSNNTVIVVADPQEQSSANFLNDYLQHFYGFSLKTVSEAANNYVRLSTRKLIKAPDNDSRYTMTVKPDGV